MTIWRGDLPVLSKTRVFFKCMRHMLQMFNNLLETAYYFQIIFWIVWKYTLIAYIINFLEWIQKWDCFFCVQHLCKCFRLARTHDPIQRTLEQIMVCYMPVLYRASWQAMLASTFSSNSHCVEFLFKCNVTWTCRRNPPAFPGQLQWDKNVYPGLAVVIISGL